MLAFLQVLYIYKWNQREKEITLAHLILLFSYTPIYINPSFGFSVASPHQAGLNGSLLHEFLFSCIKAFINFVFLGSCLQENRSDQITTSSIL